MLFEISNFNRLSQQLSAMNCEEISTHCEPHNISAKFYRHKFYSFKISYLFNRDRQLFEMLVFIIRIIWILSNIWSMFICIKRFILIVNGWLLKDKWRKQFILLYRKRCLHESQWKTLRYVLKILGRAEAIVRRCFFKIDVLKNFANFTGNNLCWCFFLIQSQA